jgi:hypothetical protein
MSPSPFTPSANAFGRGREHRERVRPEGSGRRLHLPAIETFVLGHLAGTPVAEAVASLSEEKRAALARQVKIALQPFADGDGVAVPDEVNIAIAHK